MISGQNNIPRGQIRHVSNVNPVTATKIIESEQGKCCSMNTISIENCILHLDDHIIVVDKPAGLRVIPDGYDPSLPNLRDILHAIFPNIWVVHRLDKETSGVILFARNAATHRALNTQFQNRTIKKEYRLISIGTPDWQSTTINLPLRTNGDRKHRTVVDFGYGKPAKTDFTLLEQFSLHALLAAFPHSGYTHQIRSHISAAGFPVLGDSLYWQAASHIARSKNQHPVPAPASYIDRVALHAAKITFIDPFTNSPHIFTAELPPDFTNCLEKIRFL